MFCAWSVAKPNYYLPCLPAAAILTGLEWVRLTRAARRPEEGMLARRVLQFHWVVLFVGAMVVPVVVHQNVPRLFAITAGLSLAVASAVVASAWLWRKGADAAALAPLVTALAAVILIGYGTIAPAENRLHGHRTLAETLKRVLPADAKTVMFFHELDEGLWFYLRDRTLAPIPGSQPEYNDAFRLIEDIRNNRFEYDINKRLEAQQKILVDWLRQPVRPSSYVLIREDRFDRFAPALAGLAEPMHREHGLKRNELVLLRANTPAESSTRAPRSSIAARAGDGQSR
jgi:hypothetical protein